jgi:hypothetical protein
VPRGSKIGEHRGGRERGTPNRRTVLANRILALAVEHPTASAWQLVDILVKDRQLPADIRIAISQEFSRPAPSQFMTAKPSVDKRGEAELADARPAPSHTTKLASLDVLWSITQDTTVPPIRRHKAAAAAAQHFLPKKPGPKRWWENAPVDEYGFAITPQIAAEYRDIKAKLLDALKSGENNPVAVKLRRRVDAILQRLPCPCPSLYGIKQLDADLERLVVFARQRKAKVPLSASEDAEEAHCKARVDSLGAGPECAARWRLNALTDKERIFRKGFGPRLTWREQVDLRFLRLLYPTEKPPRLYLGNAFDYEPLRDEPLAADGNLYPAGSKLAPLKDGEIEEFIDIPPFVYGHPGYPGHRWAWY